MAVTPGVVGLADSLLQQLDSAQAAHEAAKAGNIEGFITNGIAATPAGQVVKGLGERIGEGTFFFEQSMNRGDVGGAVYAAMDVKRGIEEAGVFAGSSIVEGINLNSNLARSRFGVYEIHVNGELDKIGKADLNRVTKSSGLPTRLHQQVRKLEKTFGRGNVTGRVVEDLGEATTLEAKKAETARLRAYHNSTGKVPRGNKKSFKP